MFPFEIVKLFPTNANDCASVFIEETIYGVDEEPFPVTVTFAPAVTVVVGIVKEPPPFESVTVFPACDNVCNSLVTLPSTSTNVGRTTVFPFEIVRLFPTNANDCASVSVNVGRLKEPPPFESVTVFPACDNVCNSLVTLPSTSTNVGRTTVFPFEIVRLFPTNANDCASVSVNVGRLKEPPPFESVTVFPACDNVCNSLVILPSTSTKLGKLTGLLEIPLTVVTS